MILRRPWNKRRWVPLAVLLAVLAWLLLYVDDWSRDFTTNEAFVSPVVSGRSREDLVREIRSAARRLRGWEHVGEVQHGNTTRVVLVRTTPIWRFKDDVILRVEDRGDRRAVSGESRSRIGVGDLGQNPRNLRMLFDELKLSTDRSGAGP